MYRIEVVPAEEVDAIEAVALLNRAYERYPQLTEPRIDLVGFREEVVRDALFIVAREGERVLGCAMVAAATNYFDSSRDAAAGKPPHVHGLGQSREERPPENPYGGDLADALYFGLVAVDLDCQDRGIGRALLGRAEAIARDRGLRRIVLTTVRQFGLVDYYERSGFRVESYEHYDAGHWSISVPHDYCYLAKTL